MWGLNFWFAIKPGSNTRVLQVYEFIIRFLPFPCRLPSNGLKLLRCGEFIGNTAICSRFTNEGRHGAVWYIRITATTFRPIDNDLGDGSVLLVNFESNSLCVITAKFVAEGLFEFRVLDKGLFDLLLRVAHAQAVVEFVERAIHADQLDRIIPKPKGNVTEGKNIFSRKIIKVVVLLAATNNLIFPELNGLRFSQLV